MAAPSTGLIFLLVVGILLGSCGERGAPAAGGQQTYSFRSDPDSEFIHLRASGGMTTATTHYVVYSDGRFRYTVRDTRGRSMDALETRLTSDEMNSLFELIVGSGLMTHDHRKAKIGEYRNPTREVLVYGCSDCSSPSFTIQLAENNCPGRRLNAPIAVKVAAVTWAANHYPDVPELQASARLWRILLDYKKRVEQARSRS